MSYAGARMSLMEVQKDIARRVRHVNLISELDMSSDDYHYIAAKIRMLFKFPNDNSIVDDYKLVIVTYWVYSMLYDDCTEMDKLFDGLPQYKKKYYFEVCMEAFDEYGIERFDLNVGMNPYESKALIARHAGIPPSDFEIVFDTISEYQDCAVVDDVIEAVVNKLPKRSRDILLCYTDEMRRSMVMSVRNFMITALNSDEPREILLNRRGTLTERVCDAIMNWCDGYERRRVMLS